MSRYPLTDDFDTRAVEWAELRAEFAEPRGAGRCDLCQRWHTHTAGCPNDPDAADTNPDEDTDND